MEGAVVNISLRYWTNCAHGIVWLDLSWLFSVKSSQLNLEAALNLKANWKSYGNKHTLRIAVER